MTVCQFNPVFVCVRCTILNELTQLYSVVCTVLNEGDCPLPHTGYFTPKKEMCCALYRRLGAQHAQSVFIDRLLYTPRTKK